MTRLNTQFAAPRSISVIPAIAPAPSAPAQVATVLPALAPLVLPPPPENGLLDWSRKDARVAGERLQMREHTPTAEELILEFHVPGDKAGDQADLTFYLSCQTHIWHHCPQARIRSKQGPNGQRLMLIDPPADLTGQAIDRAVREVETVLAFMQHIGGGLTHIHQLIVDQPQMVEDLDAVFGDGARLLDLKEAAVRLADRFTAAGRPDLKRLTLDTALLLGSRQDDRTAVEALIEAGAAIDAADGDGWTSLTHACKSGHVKMAALLIGNGADIEGRQKSGMTPLMAACHWGHVALAQCLLTNKADIGRKDAEGWTPLMWAWVQGTCRGSEASARREGRYRSQGRRWLDAADLGCRRGACGCRGFIAASGGSCGREGPGWQDRGNAGGGESAFRNRRAPEATR